MGFQNLSQKFGTRKTGFSNLGSSLLSDPVMGYETGNAIGYEIDWINTKWKKRIPLTINPGQITGGAITNFPFVINSTFPELIGKSEGAIRFADVNNKFHPYHIEKFDSFTGALLATTLKPTIDVGDLTYLYFDNPNAVDAQDPSAVWADFDAVYLFKDGETGIDSSGNGNHLTHFGTTLVLGKLGNGISYNGTPSSFSRKNPVNSFPTTEITMLVWMKSPPSATLDGLISYAVSQGSNNEFLTIRQEGMRLLIKGTGFLSQLVFNDDVFHLLIASWNSSNGFARIMKDDGNPPTAPLQVGESLTAGGSLVLGQTQIVAGSDVFPPNRSYTGILNRVLFARKVFDFNTKVAFYNNQNDANSFYSIGTVKNAPIPKAMGYETV